MSIRERAKPIAIRVLGPNRMLGVPFVTQQMTCWCWAACAAMVLKYYHLDFGDQCAIAAKGLEVLDPSVCCSYLTSERCNLPLLDDGITTLWRSTNVCAVFIPSQISDIDLFKEIESERPVEIGYGPTVDEVGIGHVVIAVGWQGNDLSHLSFLIYDPLFQARTALAQFVVASTRNKRTWVQTWVQLEKATP
jgi:papain like cysteine protease AvrRpt2